MQHHDDGSKTNSLHVHPDSEPGPEIEGIPLREFNELRLSPCVECGKEPDEGGGEILELEMIEGKLWGKQICFDCMSDEDQDGIESHLDQLRRDFPDARRTELEEDE